MLSSQQADRVWAVLGLVASGGFALLGAAAPTDLARWDGVLRLAFGLIAPLALAGSPRWAWFGALAVTGGLAAGPEWLLVAGLGMVLAIALEVTSVESQLGRIAIGIAVVHGLLHLRPVGPFGTTAVVGALVVIGASVLSLRGDRGAARRAVLTFGGFVALLAVLASGAAVAALLGARGDLDAGSAAARRGLDMARDGDPVAAAGELAESSRLLGEADRRLHAWWVEPGRLVPVVGQHLAAARATTGPVAELVAASSQAIDLADVDRLRLSGGAVDLALIESMAQPLADVERTMRLALAALRSVDSPWLVPPVRDAIDDAAIELTDTYPEAEKAALATKVMPSMLGAEAPRRYLVMFAMPAEARELGGIMSTYLELTASNGAITVTDQGTASQLNRNAADGATDGVLDDPGRYPARFIANKPELFTTNWTSIPDLPMVAEAVSSLYPGFGGRSVDGVIYLDPIGVAGLMRLSGPVELPGIGRTIDADSVVEFLNVGQYETFDDQTERKEYLTDIAAATFSRLLTGELPSPRELGRVLGPAARGGHLQMATLDASTNDFLRTLFMLGEFPTPTPGVDFLSVVQTNGEANKIDSFLERDVDYRVRLNDNGDVRATASITLTNTATLDLPDYIIGTPPDGYPVGTTHVQLSIYTPHFLDTVSIDGTTEMVEPQVELGWQRYLIFVDVPAGASSTVRFELDGRLELDDDEPYRLSIANQALINDDHVSVTLENANDDRVIGSTELELVEDTIVEFER
ncbi:MAG: DUF4012 domain-containing protein [Acidimicrobiales bacterium]